MNNSKPIEMYTAEEVNASMPYVQKNLELAQEVFDATAERLKLLEGLPGDAFMPLNPQFSFESNKDFAENSKRKQVASIRADLNAMQSKIDANLDYIQRLEQRLVDIEEEKQDE